MFFGLSAIGYEAGVVGILLGIGYCIGLAIFAKYVPRIRSLMNDTNSDSLDEVIGKKYGVQAQIAATTINYLFFVSVLAAQFIALGSFVRLFPEQLNANYIYWVVAASVILYTAVSGFKGVLLTDRWQFVLISISVTLIAVVGLLYNNPAPAAPLDKSYFVGTRYGIGFVVAILLFFPFTILARADLWQRISAADSARSAQQAIYWSIPLLLIFYVLLDGIGFYARATLGPNIDPATSGLVLFTHGVNGLFGDSILGSILNITVFIGVISALVSTIDTNLNVISVATSKLLLAEQWQRDEGGPETAGRLLFSLRVISILIGSLGILAALYIPSIVDVIVGAGAMILILLPAVWYMLRKDTDYDFKPMERLAGFLSLVLGFATLVALLIFMDPKTAFLPAALISIVIFALLIAVAKFRSEPNKG